LAREGEIGNLTEACYELSKRLFELTVEYDYSPSSNLEMISKEDD
jgi:hypothetical protein